MSGKKISILVAIFSIFLFSGIASASPNIVASNIQTFVSGNQIITKMTITNNGDTMLSSNTGTTNALWLIEMQVRPTGLNPLAFLLPQNVCDATHPENVNVKFNLISGESANIELRSSVANGRYDVYLISRNKCWIDYPQGNTPVSPFPNFVFRGTFGVPTDSVTTTTTPPLPFPYCGNLVCDFGETSASCPTDCPWQPTTTTTPTGGGGYVPNIILTQHPVISVSGKIITTSLAIKNTGVSMLTPWLIEMQPRPQGLLPLTIFPQYICDTMHPENVNVKFQLAQNEEQIINLVSAVERDDGRYDIYLLSRDKCWAESPQGNIPVQPYATNNYISTITVGSGALPPQDDNMGIYLLIAGALVIMIIAVLVRK